MLGWEESIQIPVKSHRSAVNAMLELKQRLSENDERMTSEQKIILTTTGCMLQRRIALQIEDDLNLEDLNEYEKKVADW